MRFTVEIILGSSNAFWRVCLVQIILNYYLFEREFYPLKKWGFILWKSDYFMIRLNCRGEKSFAHPLYYDPYQRPWHYPDNRTERTNLSDQSFVSVCYGSFQSCVFRVWAKDFSPLRYDIKR